MQPLSGNQRPGLLTSLMNMSRVNSCNASAGDMHLSRSCSNAPRLPSFLDMLQNPHVFLTFETRCTIPCACHAKQHLNVQKCSEHVVLLTFWLRNMLRATTACTFSTSQFPKVVGAWCVLFILTSKCASRHNGVHFFDISTSKSGPSMVCFVHFDFEMCFAPQRRALFRHLNFQKRSDTEVFCAFWLTNVLRATTACTFSTSQLPKVVRAWCVLYILTSKRASRHNGVQFFISHLARWLRTRRFSELTFRPSAATNHWKNAVFRDFPTFSRTCIFFLLTLSLLWSSLFCSSLFFSSLFYSSLLFDSSHLCFLSVHIVGSLISKLPSAILEYLRYPWIASLDVEYCRNKWHARFRHCVSFYCIAFHALRCIALTFTLQILQHIKLRFDTKQPSTLCHVLHCYSTFECTHVFSVCIHAQNCTHMWYRHNLQHVICPRKQAHLGVVTFICCIRYIYIHTVYTYIYTYYLCVMFARTYG